MRYIRDNIGTGHIRRGVYSTSVYLQVKKRYKVFNKKSINQSPVCTNAEIELGGGTMGFSPNKRYRYQKGR